MERYPSGIGEQGFWQKDVSRGFPAWLQRVEVPKKDGVVHHPLVTDTRSLLWITNQNTITQHVWTSRTPRLEYPDLVRIRSRSAGGRFLRDPRGRDRAARSPGRAVIAVVGQDLGLEGLPRRRPAQRADSHRHGGRVRARRGRAAGPPRGRSTDPGIQQGGPPRTHLRGHRAGTATARRSRRRTRSAPGAVRRSRRPARGRSWNGATCTRAPSRCATCPNALRRSATCGPACGAAGDRSGSPSRSCAGRSETGGKRRSRERRSAQGPRLVVPHLGVVDRRVDAARRGGAVWAPSRTLKMPGASMSTRKIRTLRATQPRRVSGPAGDDPPRKRTGARANVSRSLWCFSVAPQL